MRLATAALMALILVGCGGGGSSSSGPKAPDNVEVSSQGGEILVTWDAVEGADSYYAYFASEPNIDPDHHAALDDSGFESTQGSSVTLTPPDLFEPYWVVVTTLRGDRESKPSEEFMIVPRYEIPDATPQTVIDHATDLEWQRCARGLSWDQGTESCEGDVTRDNVEGHAAGAAEVPGEGWRVPGVVEAMTLVYCPDGLPDYFQREDFRGTGQFCDNLPVSSGNIALYRPVFDRAEIYPYLTTSFAADNNFKYTLDYETSGVGLIQDVPEIGPVVHYVRSVE